MTTNDQPQPRPRGHLRMLPSLTYVEPPTPAQATPATPQTPTRDLTVWHRDALELRRLCDQLTAANRQPPTGQRTQRERDALHALRRAVDELMAAINEHVAAIEQGHAPQPPQNGA